eukprot:jgi/Astpho2/9793/Aster-03766
MGDIFSGKGLAALGHAILGWLVAMPVIIVALSLALKPVFAWAASRMGGDDSDMEERMLADRQRADDPWDASAAESEQSEAITPGIETIRRARSRHASPSQL